MCVGCVSEETAPNTNGGASDGFGPVSSGELCRERNLTQRIIDSSAPYINATLQMYNRGVGTAYSVDDENIEEVLGTTLHIASVSADVNDGFGGFAVTLHDNCNAFGVFPNGIFRNIPETAWDLMDQEADGRPCNGEAGDAVAYVGFGSNLVFAGDNPRDGYVAYSVDQYTMLFRYNSEQCQFAGFTFLGSGE